MKLLRWAGSKLRMLAQYDPYFPKQHHGGYVEPMCGSAAVAFEWWDRWCGPVYLSDKNPELMGLFHALKCAGPQVAQALGEYVSMYNAQGSEAGRAAMYEAARLALNACLSAGSSQQSAFDAATMIFLNRTGFNGLFRVNRAGGYNVPFGKLGRLSPHLVEAALRTGAMLADPLVHLVCADFTWVDEYDYWVPGTVFYFDPPFDGVFAAYTKQGFRESDQYRLRNLVECLVARGMVVYVANSDTPFIRSIYAGHEFEIIELQGRRSISCDGGTRGVVSELLIRGA